MPNQVERVMLNQLSYNSFGALTSARLGNGRWESMEYDSLRGQLTKIAVGGSIGDASVLKLEYNYASVSGQSSDNNGALRKQTITLPGVAPIEQNYTYDALNRLDIATETVGSNVQWRQDFNYDRFGNRTFNAANTTTLGTNNAITNPDVNPADNKFYQTDGYVYDSEGNLTSGPDGVSMTYNADNKQSQAVNSVTQTTTNYDYDGIGKRVRKASGNKETYFVYDAFGKLVAEYTTNQAIITEGAKFLTADLVGSPRVSTNNLGQVSARHDFMPFGEEVAAGLGNRSQVAGFATDDGVRQHFTGYERDTESGLDFAQNRYFAARLGRFTSVDPLAASASARNPQTLNRYTFGLNSPYQFNDPLGLAPCGVSGGPGSAPGRTCTQADDLSKDTFNRALARYIFDRASKGYIDDTGGMTTSMFTAFLDTGRLRMSPAGLQLLKELEGLPGSGGQPSMTPYLDAVGKCTIGWGHLLPDSECKEINQKTTPEAYRKNHSEEQTNAQLATIENLFMRDVAAAVTQVNMVVNSEVSQNEFDALVMLSFNYPISTRNTPKLIKALNSEWGPQRHKDIRTEWEDIVNGGGRKVDGLVNRRRIELRVFFDGVYKNE